MLNAFFLSLVIWCIGLQAQLVARDDDLYASNFQVKTDSTPRTIHKLGIITKHVTPNQISEHQNTTRLRTSQNVKIFSNVALGYVTPWNKKGYDIAEKYRHKFDYISPIWYYIKPISPNIPMTYKLEGAHDVDQGTITARSGRLNELFTVLSIPCFPSPVPLYSIRRKL
ncbi:hypothetical protein SeLEV6574_g06138 [Synchytrium endobioticum]|uniref:Uncharacterized protein n=1 Tax=Synchytrium endobioticum TaxID=286115 RepID=A0A507CQC3_9FUNG|nr:hypothetical protein SeLEV6574_g06138 [Synchytrium endobioticum]